MIVQPSPVDVAQAKKSQTQKAATRTARLARRRRTYAEKKRREEKEQNESDEDEADEPMDETPDENVDQPEQQSQTGGRYHMDPLTREDHVRGLFGHVSDISSDTTANSNEEQEQVTFQVQPVCDIAMNNGTYVVDEIFRFQDGNVKFIATEQQEDPVAGPSVENVQAEGNVTLATTEVLKAVS